MLVSEARWIGDRLLELPATAFPVLHVGSSSGEFRTRSQPWIEREIFARLKRASRAAVHVDIKNDDGVDVVADVTQPQGLATLREQRAGTVLCANLLEHVADAPTVLAAVASLVPTGGYLLVTCPRHYPLHPDPIDTGFRPSADELAHMVGPGFEVLVSAELTCRRLFFYYAEGRPARLALRLLVPVYRPATWLQLVRWVWQRPVQSVTLLRRV